MDPLNRHDINTSSTPSLWISKTKVKDYPALDQDLSCQVLIIGGGITGMSCAYELTEAGHQVVLIEKNRLCSKATGNTTGKLTIQHSHQYSELLDKNRESSAKALLDSQTTALARFREITEKHTLNCDQIDAQAVLYGRDKQELKAIDKEQNAYDQLGIPYERVSIDFEEGAGLAIDAQIGFNAAKYVYALAEHLSGRGVSIYEHSKAENQLETTPHGSLVRVNGRTITADYIILASGYPAIDGGAHYSFRLVPSRSLALAFPYERTKAAMYISQGDPVHSVRYTDSDGSYLIVAGGAHRVGFENDVTALQDEMKQFAQTAFGVSAPSHGWSAQDYLTADRLPYIGRLTDREEHRNVFTATGFRKWGLGFGIWTGLYLTGLIEGSLDEIEAFRPSRDMLAEIAVDQAVDKTKMLFHSLTDRQKIQVLEDLGPGQGGIVKLNGKKLGVWIDGTGAKSFVDLSCTHMGCSLHWNDLEKSFDCPCHGSRFTREGLLIEGPASRDLGVPDDKYDKK